MLEALLAIFAQAEGILVVLANEEDRIQADATFSDLGKVKEMTMVVRDAYDKLKFVEKKATERHAAYDSESIPIHAAPKLSSDALVNAFREAEISRKWQAAPLHEQMRAYQMAAQNGAQVPHRTLRHL